MIVLWTALAAACPEAPAAALDAALTRAEAAWEALDGTALDEAHGDLREAVGCLAAPVTPATALQVHLVEARHAWTVFDTDASTRAWLAVRDLAPTWTDELDADVPGDHPVRALWDSRKPWTRRTDEQPLGGWVIDGTPAEELPMDRAFLAQALDADGTVAYTGWHATLADLPQRPWRDQRLRRIRRRGSLVAGVGAVIGLGLVGGALATRATIRDPSTPPADLRALQGQANGLGAAGLGTLGASGLAVGLLWGVRW